MHAYDEIYVAKAQTALGQMLRYAVEDCRCDLNEFWDMFLISGVADMFGSGDYLWGCPVSKSPMKSFGT